MTRSLALALNALGLYAVALVLVIAFAAQLLLNELPCPLCLLQRIQFAMLAVRPILNLPFGPPPRHYAASLFTAIAGAAFGARQRLLRRWWSAASARGRATRPPTNPSNRRPEGRPP